MPAVGEGAVELRTGPSDHGRCGAPVRWGLNGRRAPLRRGSPESGTTLSKGGNHRLAWTGNDKLVLRTVLNPLSDPHVDIQSGVASLRRLETVSDRLACAVASHHADGFSGIVEGAVIDLAAQET